MGFHGIWKHIEISTVVEKIVQRPIIWPWKHIRISTVVECTMSIIIYTWKEIKISTDAKLCVVHGTSQWLKTRISTVADSIRIFKLSDGCDIIKYRYTENEKQKYLIVNNSATSNRARYLRPSHWGTRWLASVQTDYIREVNSEPDNTLIRASERATHASRRKDNATRSELKLLRHNNNWIQRAGA